MPKSSAAAWRMNLELKETLKIYVKLNKQQ